MPPCAWSRSLPLDLQPWLQGRGDVVVCPAQCLAAWVPTAGVMHKSTSTSQGKATGATCGNLLGRRALLTQQLRGTCSCHIHKTMSTSSYWYEVLHFHLEASPAHIYARQRESAATFASEAATECHC